MGLGLRDGPAIPANPAIRNLEAVPKAFFDASLFSSAAEQRTYRPVTATSLAIDRWLTGSQLSTFYFHFSTFFWSSVQLVLMVLLFERILHLAVPHPSNVWAAVAAVALFGLHPVNAGSESERRDRRPRMERGDGPPAPELSKGGGRGWQR